LRSSILKKFTYWLWVHWRTVFTDEAFLFPSIMVGDVCGGTKIDLKTVASRNVIGCVMRHYWLWWGLLWLFYWLVRHPKRRFDRVPLSRWDQSGICDPLNGAVDQDFVLIDGNALPCRACFVNDYTERERNRMYGLAWPSPHVNLTRACMVQTPRTYKCSASSTTDAVWPRKRAHLRLGKNLSFCNQKTDSQLHLYV